MFHSLSHLPILIPTVKHHRRNVLTLPLTSLRHSGYTPSPPWYPPWYPPSYPTWYPPQYSPGYLPSERRSSATHPQQWEVCGRSRLPRSLRLRFVFVAPPGAEISWLWMQQVSYCSGGSVSQGFAFLCRCQVITGRQGAHYETLLLRVPLVASRVPILTGHAVVQGQLGLSIMQGDFWTAVRNSTCSASKLITRGVRQIGSGDLLSLFRHFWVGDDVRVDRDLREQLRRNK